MKDGITRREFAMTSTAMVTLSVMGCGDSGSTPPVSGSTATPTGNAAGGGPAPAPGSGGNPNRANLATEPFQIGKPRDFAKPAIYDAFKKEKGVWIVSDGKEIVVFSATCTHTGCTTNLKSDQFVCPCHESKFDTAGTNLEGAKAKRPLDRCSVSLVITPAGDIIEVDPRKLLRKADGGWEVPDASIKLT